MSQRLKWTALAGLVLLGTILLIYYTGRDRPLPPDPALERLERLTTIAERLCLVNSDSAEADELNLEINAALDGIKSAASIEQRRQIARGAAARLTSSLQQVENDAIRQCMQPFVTNMSKAATELATGA